MKPAILIATLALVATAPLTIAIATATAAETRVIADLHKEWETALPTRSQPLGSWLLLRGAPDTPLSGLTPLDRFEQKVGGNPDVAIWSYGNSIYNQPGFARRLDAGNRPVILVSPQKNSDQNEQKGTACIQWTSPVTGTPTLVLTLQNLGTDVKGGAGMTLVILQYPSVAYASAAASSAATAAATGKEIHRIKIPNAANSPAPATHEIPLTAAGGDRFLIRISPVVDGYGNRLALQARVLVTD
jgi:hypothetical protein